MSRSVWIVCMAGAMGTLVVCVVASIVSGGVSQSWVIVPVAAVLGVGLVYRVMTYRRARLVKEACRLFKACGDVSDRIAHISPVMSHSRVSDAIRAVMKRSWDDHYDACVKGFAAYGGSVRHMYCSASKEHACAFLAHARAYANLCDFVERVSVLYDPPSESEWRRVLFEECADTHTHVTAIYFDAFIRECMDSTLSERVRVFADKASREIPELENAPCGDPSRVLEQMMSLRVELTELMQAVVDACVSSDDVGGASEYVRREITRASDEMNAQCMSVCARLDERCGAPGVFHPSEASFIQPAALQEGYERGKNAFATRWSERDFTQ